MKEKLRSIMARAWEIRKERERCTMATALRLAWGEAKGEKRYTVDLENLRAGISAYLAKLVKAVRDEHDQHKVENLRAALLAKVDQYGIAVVDGKTAGLCKYACKNAL